MAGHHRPIGQIDGLVNRHINKQTKKLRESPLYSDDRIHYYTFDRWPRSLKRFYHCEKEEFLLKKNPTNRVLCPN